jgi:hypothetical protein
LPSTWRKEGVAEVRHSIGDREQCTRCGQEIEFHGKKEWRDRGNNRHCVPYINREEEVIEPINKLHTIKEQGRAQ